MEYTKLNLVNGEVIRQEHLEHFEDAIAKLADELNSIEIPADSPIQYIESTDTSNLVNIRDLESGTYVFYGKFKPFSTSTASLTFSSKLLVNVVKRTADSQVMVFYPVNNCVQYLKITDDSYERKNIYLNDLQTEADVIDTVTSAIDAKQRIQLWRDSQFLNAANCPADTNVNIPADNYTGFEVIFVSAKSPQSFVSTGFIPADFAQNFCVIGRYTTKLASRVFSYDPKNSNFVFQGGYIHGTDSASDSVMLPVCIYGFK